MSSSRIKRTKQIALRLCALALIAFIPWFVSAQSSHIFDDNNTGNIISKNTGLGSENVADVTMSIANSVLAFVSVIVFALVAYGGMVWMLARGEAKEVKKAQDIIKAAVVGLFIVMAAWGITLVIAQAVNRATVGSSGSSSGGGSGGGSGSGGGGYSSIDDNDRIHRYMSKR